MQPINFDNVDLFLFFPPAKYIQCLVTLNVSLLCYFLSLGLMVNYIPFRSLAAVCLARVSI